MRPASDRGASPLLTGHPTLAGRAINLPASGCALKCPSRSADISAAAVGGIGQVKGSSLPLATVGSRDLQATRSSRPLFFSVVNVESELPLTLDRSALVQPDSVCVLNAFGLIMLADPDSPICAAVDIEAAELPLESSWFQF
jgi:hypothetical protein